MSLKIHHGLIMATRGFLGRFIVAGHHEAADARSSMADYHTIFDPRSYSLKCE